MKQDKFLPVKAHLVLLFKPLVVKKLLMSMLKIKNNLLNQKK